ncbi:hypothetical protein ACFOPQ_04210 [Deinococcus antarcticus]|uniref:Uncharacterized protein n=1 Tax=Deinococcus antarcticus TaxID=1298767 RepID=A0ABV8A3G0_9DEIO
MLRLLVGNRNLIGVQLDARRCHFTKPSGYREVNLFWKQVTEFMERQRRVVGDHRLRFTLTVAAPETQFSQMFVRREWVGAEAVQAVSCPLPAALLGVVMLGWIAVAQVQGLNLAKTHFPAIYDESLSFRSPIRKGTNNPVGCRPSSVRAETNCHSVNQSKRLLQPLQAVFLVAPFVTA